MQKYKISFKGQNIYVGIDVHLKTWHVTTLTETGCKYSFAQHSDAKELLDSEKIAWALKRGQLTGIYVKDKSFMDDANLMRLRQRFIKDLSRQKNRLKHLLYTQGVTYPERFAKSGTHWSRNFMKWLREEVVLLSEEKLTLMLLCDQVDNTRDAEIRRLSQSDKYKENYDLLTTIPGFGLITSMSMQTELDNNPARFPNERKFVSFLGLIPTCHDSGEKKVSGEKTFRGNKHLGPLIVEASWIAIQRDYDLGAYHANCCQRMKPQKAIIKVARRLASRAYAVMKTKKAYVLR